MMKKVEVLFVDLDGTLVATDILREVLAFAVKHRPWIALLFLLGAVRGRAAAKRAVAKHIIPAPARLPFREDVVHFISDMRASGRRVVLATASDAIWADAIARHVGCFDDVLASDGQHNLKGVGKLKAIQTYCQQFGFAAFAYLGDAMADLPIWQHAAQVYVVSPSPKLLAALRRQCPPARIVGQDVIG
jgi:phosphoserine phosphatase